MQLTIICLLSWLSIMPTPETDSLVIFNPNRTYHYQATFISPSGDTLSKERVTFKPKGQPWKYDKSQTAFEIQYNYTPEDSVTFLSYLNPKTKKEEKPESYSWFNSETTGAIEDGQQVWIHPIRSNQYNYTEVAPFPSVVLDSLKEGGEWNKTVFVLTGWGAFKGQVESHYQTVKQETKQYGNLTLADCWLINSVGKHSKLDGWILRMLVGKGKELDNSYLDFYFHPRYGFVEMNYRFYDGAKISFVLEEIIDKEV